MEWMQFLHHLQDFYFKYGRTTELTDQLVYS
jgi:hypothetical protein